LPAVRRKIGLVFQDSESQLFMPTVLEDVAFGPMNRGLGRDEALRRAASALKTVGMEGAASRAPYHLSAGEKKRVAIAGILATDAEILVLDEPTTSLDPPGQRALAELLTSLPQAKIIATHDIPFAMALCSRAVFFQRGAIAGQGSVPEVVSRFGWDFALNRSHPLR
jgi:cobalt/nickel transport system ATP-binding protein